MALTEKPRVGASPPGLRARDRLDKNTSNIIHNQSKTQGIPLSAASCKKLLWRCPYQARGSGIPSGLYRRNSAPTCSGPTPNHGCAVIILIPVQNMTTRDWLEVSVPKSNMDSLRRCNQEGERTYNN